MPSLDGIRKTKVYKIIPRVIKQAAPLQIPLRVPLPPQMKPWKPMLSAFLLLCTLAGGWSALTVFANRTLTLTGEPQIDITNIPWPWQDENVGPIPLSTGEPDLKTITATFTKLVTQYRESQEPIDDLSHRVEKLREYLATKNSPLADDTFALETLAQTKNMHMILGITFVESNFCLREVAHNCSGIGGSTYFRHYPNYAHWILDLEELLEKRYKGLDVEEMNCYYVQPCNANWVRGIYQILNELKARGIE